MYQAGTRLAGTLAVSSLLTIMSIPVAAQETALKWVGSRLAQRPAFKVDSVKFAGNTYVTPEQLRAYIIADLMFRDRAYDPELADNDVARLKRFYNQLGFIDVQITHRVYWDALRNTTTLVYDIDEGCQHVLDIERCEEKTTRRPMKVERIMVVGNEVTPRKTIVNQLGIKCGETITPRLLAEVRHRLARLPMFVTDRANGAQSSVVVVDSGTDSPFKNLVVKVRERKRVERRPCACDR